MYFPHVKVFPNNTLMPLNYKELRNYVINTKLEFKKEIISNLKDEGL